MDGMPPLLQVHDYFTWPDRFDLVNHWWNWHGMPGLFSETTLPKLAVIVTSDGAPVCFLACDQSNSIGKATLESAVTAPGLSAGEARRALQFAEAAIFSVIRPHYGLAQTFTSPAIARTLERDGWTRIGETVHLIKQIT